MPEDGPPIGTRRAVARFFLGGSASRLTQISGAMGVVWRRGKDGGRVAAKIGFGAFCVFAPFVN